MALTDSHAENGPASNQFPSLVCGPQHDGAGGKDDARHDNGRLATEPIVDDAGEEREECGRGERYAHKRFLPDEIQRKILLCARFFFLVREFSNKDYCSSNKDKRVATKTIAVRLFA